MQYLIYDLLYLILFPFFFVKEYFKREKKLRKKWLKEKFAFIESPIFEREAPILWVHAVSVGEILAASSLIKLLSSEYNIVLTTITDTGRLVAEKRFNTNFVKLYYLPFDLSFCIKTFLKKTNPKALLIMETEIWPNLINTATKSIPVALINGRLSEKSFKRYKLIKFFIKPLLKKMKLIAVQEETYAKRFLALGAPEESIQVVGNLKFDLSIDILDFPKLSKFPTPIIIAGSTHSKEEEIILKAFRNATSQGTLLLVPRHPERFDSVETFVLNSLEEGEIYIRYRKLENSFTLKEGHKRFIVLFDEMGKLASLYRICDVAIIGGSFVPHGGQNPLEALYWKKPVIIGPYTDNFPFVKEFAKEGGLLQVKIEKLGSALKELLRDSEKRVEIAQRGYELFLKKKEP